MYGINVVAPQHAIQSFGRRVDRTDCFFYFGMLAISGMHKGETKTLHPNPVV